ncbi:MAG: DNA internalization-related competence protein ComEC/Rec2 [Paenibacillaceae bacterium]|nr:DNA internalization-related competence protein ComEC/Rec2 [Paenibacillaceae bacterium]
MAIIWVCVAYVWGTVAAVHCGVWGIVVQAFLVAVGMLCVQRGGIGVVLPVVVLAYGIGASMYEIQPQHSALQLPDGAVVTVRGIAVSPPRVDGDRARIDIDAVFVEGGGGLWTGNERMRVTVRLLKKEEQDAVQTWQRGDRLMFSDAQLRVPDRPRNFGAFDYARMLQRQRMHWLVHVQGTERVTRLPGSWSILRTFDALRGAYAARVRMLYAQPVSGFMEGLLIGLRTSTAAEQYDQFTQLGLTHLLAISGLNVALYVGCILLILRLFPFVTRETKWLMAMWCIPPFILMTGAEPSVVRAGLMAMIALYAQSRHMLRNGVALLHVVAVVMLLWDPYMIHDVGFQLSFVVTLGLLVCVPAVMRLWGTRALWLGGAVAVTIVAQVCSFPLTITYFHGFSLLSFVANLVMVPIVSVVVLPLGALSVCVSYGVEPLGHMIAQLVQGIMHVLFAIVAWLVQWEWAYTVWATPPLWWLCAFYAVIGAAVAVGGMEMDWTRATRLGRSVLMCACVAMGGLIAIAYDGGWGERDAVDVAMLDVGQGDAALLRTARGKHVLIDSGGTVSYGASWKQRRDPFDVGKHVLLPLLMQRGIKKLDAVVLTHADADHFGGVRALLGRIRIGVVYFNGTVKNTPLFTETMRELLRMGIPIVPLHAGEPLVLDDSVSASVLHPPDPDATSLRPAVVEQQNSASIVLLLRAYASTFLFAGDIGTEEEARIQGIANTRVDVLKVAHHGSRTSTSEHWLQQWRPRFGVISAGVSNRYGHPHDDVLERLTAHRVRVLRTDVHGEVQFRVRRDGLFVRTARMVQ